LQNSKGDRNLKMVSENKSCTTNSFGSAAESETKNGSRPQLKKVTITSNFPKSVHNNQIKHAL